MKETNLRQADANVTVEGLVSEIALEEKGVIRVIPFQAQLPLKLQMLILFAYL